jgi:hypothetical protein
MFGWLKRRVARTMNNPARTAQATIGMALFRHYTLNSADSGSAESDHELVNRAGAAANFLNGQSPHATHVGLDLPQIYAEARQWMHDNRTMRELVVQTLRVTMQLDYMVQRGDPLSEERLLVLEEFGSEFADAPH